MNHKEKVSMGMIVVVAMASLFIVTVAPQYAKAQDGDSVSVSQTATITDDDSVTQSNDASVTQGSENAASANSFDGGPSTATAASNQEAQIGQSNTNDDNDVFIVDQRANIPEE